MNFRKLLNQASKYDQKSNFKKADTITNYLIKKAQLIDKIKINQGLDFNDPKSIEDYFLGFAYNISEVDLDASKSKINAELEKLFRDSSVNLNENELNQLDEIKSQVFSKLQNSNWYIELPEKQVPIEVSENQKINVKFDSNSSGFENAFKYIIEVEGGFSGYDPESGDPATNLGIIQSEYDEYRTSKNLPPQSVSFITSDEAKEIYFNNYWIPTQAEKIYQSFPKTAITIFDFAVNSGLGGASRLVSKVLGTSSTRFNDSMVDNIISVANMTGDDAMASNLIQNRYTNYEDIVKSNPQKAKFLKGWFNRLGKLKSYLG